MRLVVQRVSEASVSVGGEVVGRIGPGLLVLVGIARGDTDEGLAYLAAKLVELRVFGDAEGRMNLSLRDVRGEILCVSQFTLYGDCRKGRRPSYDRAERPEAAARLYNRWLEALRARGFEPRSGIFGAHMEVRLANDGPVTLLLDSERLV